MGYTVSINLVPGSDHKLMSYKLVTYMHNSSEQPPWYIYIPKSIYQFLSYQSSSAICT